MLTPAEELGLAGRRVEARVRRALDALGPIEQRGLLDALEAQARDRHLVYLRDGRPDVVTLFATPLVVQPDQVAYVHSVSQTLHRACKRLADLYLRDEDVRAILRLPDEEEAWLRAIYSDAHRAQDPVFGRLDAVCDFASAHWKETLRFLEPNLGGIGGLHLIPASDALLAELVLPALAARDPSLAGLARTVDIRDQLMEYLTDHLEAIGRPARTLAFIEPRFAASGPEEQEALAAHFARRFGVRVLHADPRELRLDDDGEVRCGDAIIDVGYRDYEVRDLLALARDGVDVEPMRRLLTENRMVSSITAELDAKSCFEVLTDPLLAARHFGPDERQVFRRHVLWTRLVADRRTTLSDGSEGDLLEHARRDRESLVLKPNRDYGGHGVTLGAALDDGAWCAALDAALADTSQRWVLQQLTALPVHELLVRAPDGAPAWEPYYVVLGFAPSPLGVAILGRASQRQVVNVAQRGGLLSTFVAPRS